MNDILYNNYIRNLTTPVNSVSNNTSSNKVENKGNDGESFSEILSKQLSTNSRVEFSKHAINRVNERNLDLSSERLERLNNGVKLAEEKGLNDTLIIVDQLAFVVNVKNNKVITTLGEEALKGNVFTNIDGTVII